MTEQTIYIDPAKFKEQVPTENGTGTTEYIFEEGDVLKFLIDAMNEAGVNIAMIHHNSEYGIMYTTEVDYFGIGISSMDAPEDAVIAGMTEIADLLNDHVETNSWTM